MNSVRNPQGEPSATNPQLAAVEPPDDDSQGPSSAGSGGSQFDLGGVVSAVTLFPLMVIICALLGAGVGTLVGYQKEPVYTANANMLVGNLSIADPGAVPGAVEASQSLASVYARLIGANRVAQEVLAATGGDPDTAVGASPIVDTPLIRVTAVSGSEAGAVNAANAAATSLSNYVADLKAPGSDTRPIVKQYREAELAYAEELNAYNQLEDRIGPSPTPDEQRRLNEANADLQALKLKRESLQILYQRGQNIQVSQPSLKVFERAGAASNDRGSTVQVTAAIGLLAGLALGAALATFRANRWAGREA